MMLLLLLLLVLKRIVISVRPHIAQLLLWRTLASLSAQ
jgi:hypothetical protein